jgi:cell division protein FtsI/penicillin-binding protein 2
MTPSHVSPLRWRFTSIGAAFALVGIVIFIQLVRIQVSPQAEIFRKQSDLYSGIWKTIDPARGQIYDRWGHLLAGNRTVYQIGVEMQAVEDPASIAFAMQVVLGEDYDRMFGIASPEANPDIVYAVLADYVPADKVLQLQQFAEEMEGTFGENQPIRDLSGLMYTPHLQRSYPENDLASNVLGFVSREGRGYFGVEEKYNDLLAGVSKTVWMPTDPNQIEALPDIPPGTSVILTIDREIQEMVENVLDEEVTFWGAESGTILVMDPETGEILAMASTGRINLNEYWKFSEQIGGQTPFNRAIGQDYEPGSVFKVLTMASALDAGVIKPETEFLDTGLIEVGGAQIRNWNWGAWGPQNMTGCMQHSLNVCLAWIATELGSKQFYEYMHAFGFGHSTGVDLAGEVVGRLRLPGDANWYAADLATNSFGQGLSVTPVQMLMAVSALANDGQMVVPHTLLGMVNNGHQYNPPPQVAGYPITAETAHTITEMLAVSLETEASVALVEGYRVAGKTGTGEIPTPYGYTSDQTNTSFVGWGPVDDPQFLVYVWLEKPSGSIWGSEVAAPIFSEIVQRLVVLLSIPPDDILIGLNQ